jgi:hypothetical protein
MFFLTAPIGAGKSGSTLRVVLSLTRTFLPQSLVPSAYAAR